MAAPLIVGAAIAGGLLGGGGNIFGSSADKKNRKAQERLARQKSDLYAKVTKEEKRQAEKEFKQNYAGNILGQSLSGIELNSETFQKQNQQQYQDYLQDLQNIEIQGQFYQLGVESELQSLKAQKQSGIQQALGFLSSALSGASAGASFGGQFPR